LAVSLGTLSIVRKIYPSDANFLVVKVDDAKGLYHYLISQGTVVRDRSTVILCEECLRITVGTEKENEILVSQMEQFNSK
ncbi:MAG: aminotransferase class I/II-fold pyridoxal phosphate-dependent enzyme, partial [Gemmatimonadaceae bacterium]|nr:aminotransferase class I/II-fold pyridoxal phosphate-dependent enzyme [Chitinophagaceae bacterium]